MLDTSLTFLHLHRQAELAIPVITVQKDQHRLNKSLAQREHSDQSRMAASQRIARSVPQEDTVQLKV
jgi:hypothetical protein